MAKTGHGNQLECDATEIDRLRAELAAEKDLRTLDQAEGTRLRQLWGEAVAELAEAKSDLRMYKGLLLSEQEDCQLQRDSKNRLHVRVLSLGRELELVLSGKTFSYIEDPEAFNRGHAAGHLAGMEEATSIIAEARYELPDFILDEIERRIKELPK